MTPLVSTAMQFSCFTPMRLDQLMQAKAGGARAVHHDLDVLELAAGDVAGVDEAGGGDDRRAVLVVVQDRNVQRSRSSVSMTKHSGALISSRLMPPKVGAMF